MTRSLIITGARAHIIAGDLGGGNGSVGECPSCPQAPAPCAVYYDGWLPDRVVRDTFLQIRSAARAPILLTNPA